MIHSAKTLLVKLTTDKSSSQSLLLAPLISTLQLLALLHMYLHTRIFSPTAQPHVSVDPIVRDGLARTSYSVRPLLLFLTKPEVVLHLSLHSHL